MGIDGAELKNRNSQKKQTSTADSSANERADSGGEKVEKRTDINLTPLQVVGFFAAFAVAVWFFSAIGVGKSDIKEPEELSTYPIFSSCKVYIKHQLKSPSTAKFQGMDYQVSQGDTELMIKSYVDSQNSFGATVRTDWICKAVHTGGSKTNAANWEIEYVSFLQ